MTYGLFFLSKLQCTYVSALSARRVKLCVKTGRTRVCTYNHKIRRHLDENFTKTRVGVRVALFILSKITRVSPPHTDTQAHNNEQVPVHPLKYKRRGPVAHEPRAVGSRLPFRGAVDRTPHSPHTGAQSSSCGDTSHTCLALHSRYRGCVCGEGIRVKLKSGRRPAPCHHCFFRETL